MKRSAIPLIAVLLLAYLPQIQTVVAADVGTTLHPLLRPVDSSAPHLSVIDALLSAGKDYDAVPQAIRSGPGTDGAKVALWAKLRQMALDQVKAGAYDAKNPPKVPPDQVTHFGTSFQEYRTTLVDAIKDYYKKTAGEPTPLLAQVIAPGGISTPAPPQVALSQVVTGGAPGLNVGFSATPGLQDEAEKRNFVWAHSSFSASLLVLQQVGKDPRFASAEAAYSFSTRRTLWDFLAEYNSQTVQDQLDKDYCQIAIDQSNILVSVYQSVILANSGEEKAAIKYAVETATALVKQSSSSSEQKKVIGKEDSSYNPNRFMNLSVRARVTPDAEFLDNVPDLVDLGVQWSGQLGNKDEDKDKGPSTRGSFDWSLALSGSACPTTDFSYLAHVNLSNADINALVDGTIGGTLYLPVAGGGTTKVSVSVVGRWAPLRDVKEWSLGGSFAVIVPVTSDIALAGNYGFQNSPANGWSSNFGITFAKSFQ